MDLKTKLYKLHIGKYDKKAGDITNWDVCTTTGITADEAIDRVELKKDEYILAVEFVTVIDLP